MGCAALCPSRETRDPEAIYHCGHDEKPQASQVEGNGGPGPGDDKACHSRCDDTCPLPNAGVQCHRADHDPTVDQMRIEGLTGGLIEGLNCTSEKGDNHNMPYPDCVEERQGSQQEDEARGDALGGHNQAALVESV